MIRMQSRDFAVALELSGLARDRAQIGGIACGMGLTRDVFGRAATRHGAIDLAPSQLAASHLVDTLAALEIEARRHWLLDDILIVCRSGLLSPSEPAILVATAANRRQIAIESCWYILDRAVFNKRHLNVNDCLSTPQG